MNKDIVRFAQFFSHLDYPTRQSALAYLDAVDNDVSGREDSDDIDISNEFKQES